MSVLNRRQMISSSAAAAALFASDFAAAAEELTRQHLCVFTKPFNSLSYEELADRIAELGFNGIEAPIRKGGHIEPEAVPDELPKLMEALRKRDLKMTLMTSDINDPRDPMTAKVLRTSAGLGIRRYRMKYLAYDLKKPVTNQINEWRPRFRELADLNRDLGIRGLYQNHAGRNQLGATLWDIGQVLRGISVEHLAVAYDIRHATVEGGKSWPITFNMIRPHIDTVYVKDFRWIMKDTKNVPLGKGQVDPEFFKLLVDTEFRGPISLHEEYLDHRNPDLVPQHLAAMGKDLATLRSLLR